MTPDEFAMAWCAVGLLCAFGADVHWREETLFVRLLGATRAVMAWPTYILEEFVILYREHFGEDEEDE